MAIKVTCGSCGQTLKAKDEYAGRTTKCPGCGEPLKIPEAVYDAEEMGGDDNADYEEEDYEDTYGVDQYSTESYEDDDRLPCRACGEMIRSSAAKCRFCGEVFDKSIRIRGRRSGPLSRDDKKELELFRREMNGLAGFWILFGALFLFAGLAMLLGPVEVGRDRGMTEEEMRGGGVLILLVSVIMLAGGVGTAMKQVWGIWAGIVPCGLWVLLQLFNLPQGVCCIAVNAAVIVQAKRCLDRAKTLSDAGIPLSTRP